MDDQKLRYLKSYVDHNWPIFPTHWMNHDQCSCGKVDCGKNQGKHPILKGAFYKATTDFDQIKQWHQKWPEANWGMRTGDVADGGAGVLVVDIDPRNGGEESWENLRYEVDELIETVTVESGGGGQHLWFVYPTTFDIKSGNSVVAPGIDIKANSGYVLIPPSRTINKYRFEINPKDSKVAELPNWILQILIANRDNQKVNNDPAVERIGDVIPQGSRHNALTTLAGSMRRIGMNQDEIETALLAVRDQRFSEGDHPVTEEEVCEIAKWVCEKPVEFMHTDLGNAERFEAQNHDSVQFCHKWDAWLVWDGMRWAVDNPSELKHKAYTTIRGIYAEAAAENNEKKREEIAKHAIRSEARSRIENMLHLAKAFLPVQPNELDQKPMLLNVANGTIDLTTGNLLPHNRNNKITKLIDIPYDDEAECPNWENFIGLVTGGDKELGYFLQLAVGYSLTGRTDEHIMFFLYGTGQNGKTTFTETIRRLMGDYAQRTDIEALMQSWGQGQAATPHIADMAGARFVLASEIPENRKINESLIKDLTGGDTMTARHLFSNPFTFKPVHKIWIFGNHKPRISGTDWGFWRRMRVIPFNTSIPDDVRLPMSEVMHIFDKEMMGILKWAVLGCLYWVNSGFETIQAVNEATIEYRSEQDLVQQFLDEKCKLHSDFQVKKDQLYSAWRNWCEETGEHKASRSKKWLTRQMTNRDFSHCGGGNRSLKGLKLA